MAAAALSIPSCFHQHFIPVPFFFPKFSFSQFSSEAELAPSIPQSWSTEQRWELIPVNSELASSVILFPGATGLIPMQALRGAEENTNGNGEESQKLH